jgi:hypothetical protein
LFLCWSPGNHRSNIRKNFSQIIIIIIRLGKCSSPCFYAGAQETTGEL